MMDIRSEVYNALADIMFRQAGKATKADMEQAIEWFETHFWDDEYEPPKKQDSGWDAWELAKRRMVGRRLK